MKSVFLLKLLSSQCFTGPCRPQNALHPSGQNVHILPGESLDDFRPLAGHIPVERSSREFGNHFWEELNLGTTCFLLLYFGLGTTVQPPFWFISVFSMMFFLLFELHLLKSMENGQKMSIGLASAAGPRCIGQALPGGQWQQEKRPHGGMAAEPCSAFGSQRGTW